jgi:hypothetical protein
MSDYKIDQLFRRFFSSGTYSATPQDWAEMEALLDQVPSQKARWFAQSRPFIALLVPVFTLAALTFYKAPAPFESTLASVNQTSPQAVFTKTPKAPYPELAFGAPNDLKKNVQPEISEPESVLATLPESELTTPKNSLPPEESETTISPVLTAQNPLTPSNPQIDEQANTESATPIEKVIPSLNLALLHPRALSFFEPQMMRAPLSTKPGTLLPAPKFGARPFLQLTGQSAFVDAHGSYAAANEEGVEIRRNYSQTKNAALGMEVGLKKKRWGIKTGIFLEKGIVQVTSNEYSKEQKEESYTQNYQTIDIDTTITGHRVDLVYNPSTRKYELAIGAPIMEFDTTRISNSVTQTKTYEVRDSNHFAGSIQLYTLEIPLMVGYEISKSRWMAGLWAGLTWRHIQSVKTGGELSSSSMQEFGSTELRKSSTFSMRTQLSVGYSITPKISLQIQPGINYILPSKGNSAPDYQAYPAMNVSRSQWFISGGIRYAF